MAEDPEKKRARWRRQYDKRIAAKMTDPEYAAKLAEKRRVAALSPEEKRERRQALYREAVKRYQRRLRDDPDAYADYRRRQNASKKRSQRRNVRIKDMPPERQEKLRAYWRAKSAKEYEKRRQTPEWQAKHAAKAAAREKARLEREARPRLTPEEQRQRRDAGFRAWADAKQAERDAAKQEKAAERVRLAEQRRQEREARKKRLGPVKAPAPKPAREVVMVDPEQHAHITPAIRAEQRKRWRMMQRRMA